MKKVWSHYSYVIVLIGLSMAISCILSFQLNSVQKAPYIKVTVTQGDTIWKIAEEYSEGSLSKQKFVDWVKKHNHIPDDQIYPGDQIVIPVSKKSPPTSEFASAAKE